MTEIQHFLSCRELQNFWRSDFKLRFWNSNILTKMSKSNVYLFWINRFFFFFFFALLLQNISFWCMQPVWKTLLQVNLQLNTFFFLISLTYILWLQLRLWFFLLSFWTSHCFHTLCYMVSLNLLISKNMYFSMRNVISWRSSPISVTLVWPTVVRPLCGSICAVETHKLSTVE